MVETPKTIQRPTKLLRHRLLAFVTAECSGISPVRLYWVAVGSNMLALSILLYGLASPLGRDLQVLAIILTAVSTLCWATYFAMRKK